MAYGFVALLNLVAAWFASRSGVSLAGANGASSSGVGATASGRAWDLVRKITKCLLMPLLLVAFLGAGFSWTFVAAIMLCWLGDVALLRKQEPLFFRLGLVGFLLGHVFYAITFLNWVMRRGHAGIGSGLNIPALIASIIIAVPLCWAILKLVDASVEMRVPVAAYTVVILAMAITSLQLMLAMPPGAASLIFAGSLVFMLSDTVMAYLLFHGQPRYFNVITMIPYILAQFLIVLGAISLSNAYLI